MAPKQKTFNITPEQAYELVLAALDVVGGVSPSTHDRISRKGNRSCPGVRARDLVELRRVLNNLGSGGLADTVITREHEQRQKARASRTS